MNRTRKYLLTALLTLSLCSAGLAGEVRCQQPRSDTDLQQWNDVQLTVAMAKKVDFFTMLTLRLGNNISWVQEARYAIGFVYKPVKALSINPFYWYADVRNSAGKFALEQDLMLRATYKFPTKHFGLSHRSWYEYRMRTTGISWRYRPSLTLDRGLPEHFAKNTKWYVTEEPFYDSLTGRFSRNRFTVGVTKTVNPKLAVDLFYMHQNDGFSHPGDLNVMGAAWKFRM